MSERRPGLKITRRLTVGLDNVLAGVDYEERSSVISNPDGSVVASTASAQIPRGWSQLATDIVVNKYFRRAGLHGDPKLGETSVKQVVSRIADAITDFGDRQGYFADEDSRENFRAELSFLLVNQFAAFNSPVWFNCGLFEKYGIIGSAGQWSVFDEQGNIRAGGKAGVCNNSYARPQCSACFIQSVDDDLMSIFDLAKNEARLFKYGSGTGTNFSALRGRQEKLSGGGTSSGLMSFLEVLDRGAGSTKSGGTTRRAAKMACLDMDHPEIVDFIEWKMKEEKKAQALIAQGYPSDFNGEAYHTVSGQNSNNSVRVTDAFMTAIEDNSDWHTVARTDRSRVIDTYKAKDLWNKVALSAWSCADPGLQYDTTINEWHTCKVSGRINASNPCCFVGETLVDTAEGKIRFDLLEEMCRKGEELPLVYSFSRVHELPVLRRIKKVWVAGTTDTLIEVRTQRGIVMRCTPEHRFLLHNGEYVEAKDLAEDTRLRKINRSQMGGRTCIMHRITENSPNGCEYQARWIWEQVNGPIPNGYQVHHKNHNRFDDRLSNLELKEEFVHKSDHSRGTNNANSVDIGMKRIAEVWEAVEKADHGRDTKIGSVTVWRWNKYIRNNGLQGSVPLARGDGRIRGMSWDQFASKVDSFQRTQNDRVLSVTPLKLATPVKVYDLEVEGTRNFGVTASEFDHSIVVHNSEYMFLDDTACNLASLNLTKFLSEDETGAPVFDTVSYAHACRIMFMAQEILVDYSSYPTEAIAQNSHDYRPLGIGYANLGSMLMTLGVPYDSKLGRSIAGGLTALMTGTSYDMSADIASVMGPFNGFERNRDSMLNVMRKHQSAVEGIMLAGSTDPVWRIATKVKRAAESSWASAVSNGERNGYRNAQASVLAPTGTIGLLMDCDTTGIEPDFALVKFKKLAGGGTFKIINQSVEAALKYLGYTADQISDIIRYISGTNALPANLSASLINRSMLSQEAIDRVNSSLQGSFTLESAFNAKTVGRELNDRFGINVDRPLSREILARVLGISMDELRAAETEAIGHFTIEGAPHLNPEHLPVFDCANKCGLAGTRYLSPMAHLEMMGAAQPFLSGAISKTVNLPSDATIEDIADIYYKGWKLGLKAVALYRDGCKSSQPLSSGTSNAAPGAEPTVKRQTISEMVASFSPEDAADMQKALLDNPAAEAIRIERFGLLQPRRGREKLPRKAYGPRFELTVGGQKVWLFCFTYDDGRLGEVWIQLHKAGSSMRAIYEQLAQSVSLGLQHGIPLKEYVDFYTLSTFDPGGVVTGSDYVKMANSITDAIFRVLSCEFLADDSLAQIKMTEEQRREALNLDDEEDEDEEVAVPLFRPASPAKQIELASKILTDAVRMVGGARADKDAPLCTKCGHVTVRNGACYRCLNCGESAGCS